jgi:hypothetical protein
MKRTPFTCKDVLILVIGAALVVAWLLLVALQTLPPWALALLGR